MTNWHDMAPYDGAKHPDAPEPWECYEPDDPYEGFDPQADADLGSITRNREEEPDEQ